VTRMNFETHRRCLLLSVMLLLFCAAGLGLAQEGDVKIYLEEKRVENLSEKGLDLVFYLRLDNISSRDYTLSGYSFRFVVQEREYIRLPERSLEAGLLITRGSGKMIKLPVRITYDHLFRSHPEIRTKSSITCYIMGEMTVVQGRRRRAGIPFAFNAEFPHFRMPSVATSGVKANGLTIGGADLVVELTVGNPNGFSLAVEKMDYILKFGGHPITSGTLRSPGSVDASSERLLTIPLLFNFFEVGQEVRGLLEQGVVTCQISGTLHVEIQGNRLSIPFSLSDRVPVQR
jgi:LEA14-like dessication related protein